MSVTVTRKSSRHIYFNKGSLFGYKIDGVESKLLTFRKGKVYTLDQSHPSNETHDIILTKDPECRFPITNQHRNAPAGTKGSSLKFEIPIDAPSVIYYNCQNHPYMGGFIHCIN